MTNLGVEKTLILGDYETVTSLFNKKSEFGYVNAEVFLIRVRRTY